MIVTHSALLRAVVAVAISSLAVAECQIDPTFLRRFVPDLPAKASDVTTETCEYKPIFGSGDSETRIVRGVARFGEMIIAPGGTSQTVAYGDEEQVYVILQGGGLLHYGEQNVAVRKNDFMYLPVGIRHAISNPTGQRCRIVVMGFKIPASTSIMPTSKLMLANIDDVKQQTVGGHPESTLYQLLLGPTDSTRNKLACAHQIVTLFVMTIQPGGTNLPHHHENMEEIYLVLDGEGEMVAGGGMDGIEGRHAAKAGDAYFFRLNCTVGFYASRAHPPARILAVQSLFPGRQHE